MGSHPVTEYWMDVSDASYYIKENLKIKGAEWGTPKKYFKKKLLAPLNGLKGSNVSHLTNTKLPFPT
jgi:hypothetical protein